MTLSTETIQDHIPYYLTQERKEGLLKELQKFNADEMLYYLMGRYEHEMLQGDGWTRLQLRSVQTGDQAFVNGIILSNTCDVAPENPRDFPVKIVFAPLIAVENYLAALRAAGVSEASINDKLASIKRQHITNLFYLPAGGGLSAEQIVVLDDIHSIPAVMYDQEASRTKIFTLSMAGFYLFILKLSIHFCRFHEDLDRG